MIWELMLCAAIVIGMAIIARRNMNHNYTAGSGMFKRSDDNLKKQEYVDPSEYDYYNNDGVLK